MGTFFEFIDDPLFAWADFVGRYKAFRDIDSFVVFGQVSNMAVAGGYGIVLAQVALNGFGFGGGFDDNEVFGHKGVVLVNGCIGYKDMEL